MIFNNGFSNTNTQYIANSAFFSQLVEDAQIAVDNNRIDIIRELLKKHQAMGIEYSSNFLFTTLIENAIEVGHEEIALELHNAIPEKSALFPYHFRFSNYSINTDILGMAIFYQRYNLVEKLLGNNSGYSFHIDGIKNSPNILLNYYSLIKDSEEYPSDFPIRASSIFLSSPFLLAIVIGNWEIYQLLKSYNPYFENQDTNCQEHVGLCENTKIIDDLKEFKGGQK